MVICVCALVRQSVSLCVSFWSRCICVALPGFEFGNTRTSIPIPNPTINQSINQMPPPSLSLFTAGQQQTVCVQTVHVYYSRGNHTHPVSHSPSFGEAFPTPISPQTPCPQPAPCPPTMFPPGSSPRPVVVLVLPFPLLPAPCTSWCWCWCWCCYYYCSCAVISCMSDCTRDKCQMSCPD